MYKCISYKRNAFHVYSLRSLKAEVRERERQIPIYRVTSQMVTRVRARLKPRPGHTEAPAPQFSATFPGTLDVSLIKSGPARTGISSFGVVALRVVAQLLCPSTGPTGKGHVRTDCG